MLLSIFMKNKSYYGQLTLKNQRQLRAEVGAKVIMGK